MLETGLLGVPPVPSRGLHARSHRVLERLFACYAAGSAAAAAVIPVPAAWAVEVRESGVLGPVLGSLLIGTAGLAATCMMNGARQPLARQSPALLGPAWRTRFAACSVSGAGRIAQGVLVPGLACLAGAAAWGLRAWPPSAVADPVLATTLGGLLAGLFFPALVAERFVAALPEAAVPEAPALRRLLAVPVAALPLAGGLEALRGGYAWPGYGLLAASGLLCLLAAELVVRGLARWFQPPADPRQARAAVASLLADSPAWVVRPNSVAEPLRAHFGLDFSRSWALGFLRAAVLPAVILTLLGGWGLSGVHPLGLDQRGVYERLGEPVTVFGPGLHITLPWPLGRVRTVEYGTVHAVPLGDGAILAVLSPAEAAPPAEADRLWDRPHPGEADWLIAGDGAAGQSFQVISADIRVLYRVGLTDADALHALYGVAHSESFVREVAGRTASRFFGTHTLDSVLDGRHRQMADELQTALAAALRRGESGLEVVSVTVEAVHPPAGAASAYHAVQAAEIIADTGIATETGRAHGTASLAREQSWDRLDKARATGAETVSAAEADKRRFTGDVSAQAAGGRAFLLERYFRAVSATLAKAPLTILDHRIAPIMAPTIDLRPFAAAAQATGAGDTD